MSKPKFIKPKNILAAAVVVSLILGLYPKISGAQSVSDLQIQIDSLNAEIDESQGRIDELRRRGDTLQNRLDVLNAEARHLQTQIDKTEREVRRTRVEIKDKEEELARTKELIQANIKVLYKQGNPSTLEILFSSDNFTDFINKQEYLDNVKESLNEAARESVLLKQQLEEKEQELTRKSNELDGQRRQLAVKQQEQKELIAETRGEEAVYKQLVNKRKQEVEKLRAQQAAIMAAASANRGGPDYSGFSEYPWPSVSMAYDDFCNYFNGSGSAADPWGYCKRQCTSYVAWMLHKDGRGGFYGLGHAKNWKNGGQTVANFQNAKRGDVLIWDVGTYGHVMYVESRTGAGLHVSQFNIPYDSGVYSTDFYTWNELNHGVGGYGFYLRRF